MGLGIGGGIDGWRRCLLVFRQCGKEVGRLRLLEVLIPVLRREVGRAHTRIAYESKAVSWIVLQTLGIGEDGLTARCDVTGEDVSKGMASLAAKVPRLYQGRNLREPWHCHGVAGDDDGDHRLAGICERGYELVLLEGHVVGQAVAALAVFKMILVESTYIYNKVSILCSQTIFLCSFHPNINIT